MKNKILFALFPFVFFTFISCYKPAFQVQVSSELYDTLLQLEKSPIKFHTDLYDLILVPDNLPSSAQTIASIYKFTDYSPALTQKLLTHQDSFISGLYTNLLPFHPKILAQKEEKKIIYPVIQFDNSLTNYDTYFKNQSDTKEKRTLYCLLKDIPSGYVALPALVSKNNKSEKLSFSGDTDYPFYITAITALSLEDIHISFFKKKAYEKSIIFIKDWFKKTYITSDNENTSKPFFVAAVGDILLARNVDNTLIYTKKAQSVFTNTIPVLKSNNITIGNLECVLTKNNNKTEKTYNFSANKLALPYLKDAGFNYLMITNNHSYDYGEKGFKDTLSALKKYTIATSGAGLNKTEAQQFYRKTNGKDVFSILSCGAYPVEKSGFDGEKTATASDDRAGILWESEELLNLIKQEKEKGNFVIVNVHGGQEYNTHKTPNQKALYHSFCDNGADIVFGSHPHVLQPIELYNSSMIVYSLGNFVFPGMEEMEGALDSMIVRIGILNKKIIYFEKFPCVLDGVTVKLVQ